MTRVPQPQEIYRHFKGNLYEIVTLAEHSETGEMLVIYRALYGEWKIYARPLAMFMEKTDKIKYPDAIQEYRFELQSVDKQQTTDAEQQTENMEQQAVSTEKQATNIEQQAADTNQQEITQAATEVEECTLDPMVLEFLDADTYEQRLNILTGLHHRITNDMITTMAVATDVEVKDGEVEDRYEEFKNCLLTLDRYECNRLR